MVRVGRGRRLAKLHCRRPTVAKAVLADIQADTGATGSVLLDFGINGQCLLGSCCVAPDVKAYVGPKCLFVRSWTTDVHSRRYMTALLLLASLALVSVPLAPFTRAQAVVATVRVGRDPGGIAYDSSKGEVFVANWGDNTTSVISDATDTVVATVKVGGGPAAVAYDSSKGEVLVANEGDNTTSIISDATDTVVATVKVGVNPSAIAYDSDKGEVFVANEGTDTVSVISEGTDTVVATVLVGQSPVGVAFDSSKGEVFVANAAANTVSVISDATNKVIVNVSVGNRPTGIAFDSAKSEFFVANAAIGNGTVSVISDTASASTGSTTSSKAISEFPVALGFTLLVTVVIVASYVVTRRITLPRNG